MELMNAVMEIMLLEKIVKILVPMKGGNSDEIDQRNDSNDGSNMEVSSDEGQKDDEWTKEKGAKDDGDDEESGKDSRTEGAHQIKSSCDLNVDGSKKTIRERRCN
jgi:hypothetical protein